MSDRYSWMVRVGEAENRLLYLFDAVTPEGAASAKTEGLPILLRMTADQWANILTCPNAELREWAMLAIAAAPTLPTRSP